eukprot:TRINITY_DN401_c1_g2_i3.p3 TRINITY_DN401_c1_g2~~TRINITY_DN401_c1_g2_i3.p3  ORF type:complete len:154 (-),score=24.72 TRINITY_DN401_c1_g2_i3:40-501(-)
MKQFCFASKKSNFQILKSQSTTQKRRFYLKNLKKVKCTQEEQQEQNSISQTEEQENYFDGPGFNFWIPAAYLFFVTGSIDAGYSGDWSRIGAISKETEEIMKVVSIGFGLLHFASVGTVFALGKQREKLSTVSNVFKGLLLGPLYVVEAFFAP